jgi:hypothetical protein
MGGFFVERLFGHQRNEKEFFLNLTRIIEANPKIYLSIIVGIAGCLVLFVAEAVHIQKIIELLNTKDQVVELQLNRLPINIHGHVGLC